MDHDLLIGPDGITFVYDDMLSKVFEGEEQKTERASHVEPHPTAGHGWYADMIPSGGPVLGADGTVIYRGDFATAQCQENVDALWKQLKPFTTRKQALAAERAWLREHKGL